MKKLIIGLFALAMAFGFAGCKNDADAEWKESELYVQNKGEQRIFLSLDALKKAGENPNDYYHGKAVVLNNPGFKKIVKMQWIDLETGEIYEEENEEFVLPTTLEGFYGCEGMGIINNKAIFDLVSYKSLKQKEDSEVKQVILFDDGTKLTLYMPGM